MKKKSFAPILLLSVVLLSACSDNSKRNDELFSMLSEGLENSTKRIDVSTSEVLYSLQDKLTDYTTLEKAKIWLPKANLVKAYISGMINYLNDLKAKKALDNGQTKELYNKLNQLQSNLYAIDSSIWYVFQKNLILTTGPFDTKTNQADAFYKTFFKDISHQAFLATLTRFQNNIKLIENKLIIFCHEKASPGCVLDCEFFSALAVANKSYLKPGEFIEITAGVGSFSTKVSPEFIINGTAVKVDNATGAAEYKMKVPLKPGDYSVPVKIKYTDQDGLKQEVEKMIEFTVAKECDQQ